jgi:hypothetical protein
MPQFDDDLFLGTAPTGMGLGIGDPAPMPNGVGPLGRIYVWDTVPATAVANCLATAQTATSTVTLTAGTSVTKTRNTIDEVVYVLDVPRGISITGTAGTTAVTFTVSGYDIYGQAMTEAITGPSGATTTNGKKAFKQIKSITVSATTTANVTVGTSDVLGVPVRVTDAGYVARIGWAGTLAEDTGTFVVADTATATSTTGDVRGTYDPSSACNGSRRLVMGILLPGLAVGPNATRIGALGVNQA